MEITIPNNFNPRPYQLSPMEAIDNGILRLILVWHRRAGKDKECFNIMVKKAVERVGLYYYFAPTYKQGKKIIWENIDKDGFKMLDHIPKVLIKRIDNGDMIIELISGSIIRIIGTDDYNSIVGTNPVGCVFTEYSLQNPNVWGYIRPILAENGGWAIFNGTPRGKNHFYKLFEFAKDQNDWFVQLLTVDDTNIFSKETLTREKFEMYKDLGDDNLYYQEYYCNWNVAIQGAYYSKQFEKIEQENRITSVKYDDNLYVNTHWDLGVSDSMAIWFTQQIGNEIRVIDYYENQGEGIKFYIDILKEKGYKYDRHFAPHDIKVRELSSGKSRLETAEELGIYFDITPDLPIQDGIDAARSILNRCYFDKDKCEKGINALINYTKEYDELHKCYKNKPLHDWTSHGADAFRYLAINVKDYIKEDNKNDDDEDDIKERFDKFSVT